MKIIEQKMKKGKFAGSLRDKRAFLCKSIKRFHNVEQRSHPMVFMACKRKMKIYNKIIHLNYLKIIISGGEVYVESKYGNQYPESSEGSRDRSCEKSGTGTDGDKIRVCVREL
jgi:hypothetical protein